VFWFSLELVVADDLGLISYGECFHKRVAKQKPLFFAQTHQITFVVNFYCLLFTKKPLNVGFGFRMADQSLILRCKTTHGIVDELVELDTETVDVSLRNGTPLVTHECQSSTVG
jgi:hypothetical protein